jgi:lysylphosphatidylglycerol synthetase-like protein (DUF2156 family)
MKKFPITVRLTQFFILLNALVWLVFGVIVALGLHPALPAEGLYRWGMALISFLAAAVLIVLFLLLRRRWKPAWYLAVTALAVSALLTFFDDFGWIDLAVLAVMIVPLVLMILDRKWYLEKTKVDETG